jgi:pyridoxamine 5'-phosphate oxidase
MSDIPERHGIRLSLADLRLTYARESLTEEDVSSDPIVQFKHWFDQALESQLIEPNAMALATVSPEGRPSARMVLLKEIDGRDFVFYTNYQSRKSTELAANPYAALVFYWADLERQVRVEGDVAKVPRARSEAYFNTRPRGSQLGAWASRQSQVVGSKAELERNLAVLEAQYQGHGQVPAPEFWGGFRVKPERIEFWQGRPDRLHDRLQYSLEGDGCWRIERLSP